MFAESLLESGVSSADKNRRSWSTALSISMQALLLAGLVSVSIFRPVDLLFNLKSIPLPLIVPRITPIVAERFEPSQSQRAASALVYIPLTSRDAPHFGHAKAQDDMPPPLFPTTPFARSGNGSDSLATALMPVGRGPAGPRPPDRLRLSRLDPGQLISSPRPQYPALAKQAGIQGQVVLTAIISKSGKIDSVQVMSGHPLLAAAAKAAVRNWRYRPYILNGEAVEVETQITVDFTLGR